MDQKDDRTEHKADQETKAQADSAEFAQLAAVPPAQRSPVMNERLQALEMERQKTLPKAERAPAKQR